MGKAFSCTLEDCDFVTTRRSELKKHIERHEDPSRFRCCTLCEFYSKYSRGLRTHMNTHLEKPPIMCPDMVKVRDSTSDDSSQPSVTEVPCPYTANCASGLIKHRTKRHGYVTDPKHSRRQTPTRSRVGRRARVSGKHPSSVIRPRSMSNDHKGSRSAPSYPSALVSSLPSPVEQPFGDNHLPAVDTCPSGVWDNKSSPFVSTRIDADSSAASKWNHTNRAVTTLPAPFPILANSPAVALGQDSSCYTMEKSIVASNCTYLFPEPSCNAPTHIESTDLGPASFFNTNYHSTDPIGSYPASPTSPTKLPFVNTFSNYVCPTFGQEWGVNAFSFEKEPTAANLAARVAPHYNFADHGAVATLPFPLRSNNASAAPGHDSLYIPRNVSVTSNDSAQLSSMPPYNPITLTWPDELVAGSPCSGSVASSTAGFSPESATTLLSLPSAEPFPCDNAHSEPVTLCAGGPNVKKYANTFAVVSTQADRPIAPRNRDNISLALPTHFFPHVPPETLVDDHSDATEIVPSMSELETELHEDEIFFRGTNREGCFCPEMMINAGIEGWY